MIQRMIMQPPSQPHARAQTLVYFASVFGFGAVMVSFGPVLPLLAAQVQTDLATIGLLFTFRALGFFLGSLAGGRVYDRLPGHRLLAAAGLTLAAAFSVVPLVSELWQLLAVMLVLGSAAGLLVVGSNTLVVWVHPDNVGPWMNGLSFFNGIGGFLAPIFLTAFLTTTGEIQGAFFLIAGLIALAAGGSWLTASPAIRRTADADGSDSRVRWGVVIPFALVFMLYVGAEVSFSGWLYTYTLALHPESPANAALLTAAFWAAVSIGRLLAIPLSVRLRPRNFLLIDFLLSLVSLVVILTLSASLPALWIGTIGFGLGMSSLFSIWLTFADRRVKVDGKINGIFFASTALGGMSIPWLCGQVFAARGPRATMLVIFCTLLIGFGVFVAMSYRYPRPVVEKQS
jgi:FHS family Na+ dependent glucose MFS transporter 1